MTDLGIVGLCHVGFAVRSIEEFQGSWGALLGVTDWAVVEIDQPDGALQLHGQVMGPASLRVAFARVANTAIELVEPRGGLTRTAEWLTEHGQGIHHLAFWVASLPDAVAALGDRASVSYSPVGIGAVARGNGPLPVTTPGWAYTEAVGADVPWCLELLDVRHAPSMRERFGDHLVYPSEQ